MEMHVILLTGLVVLYCTLCDGRNYHQGSVYGTGGHVNSESEGTGSSIGKGGVQGSVSASFPRPLWGCTCRPRCLSGELKVQKTCIIPKSPLHNGPQFEYYWNSCCKIFPLWVQFLRASTSFDEYSSQDGFGDQGGSDGQDGLGNGNEPIVLRHFGPIGSGGDRGSGNVGGGYAVVGGYRGEYGNVGVGYRVVGGDRGGSGNVGGGYGVVGGYSRGYRNVGGGYGVVNSDIGGSINVGGGYSVGGGYRGSGNVAGDFGSGGGRHVPGKSF